HTVNINKFIDEVQTKSGGKLKITLHSNGTLIKLDAMKRAVQAGQIPIGEIRLGVYGNEDPMYVLAGLPFIAGTYESAWKLKDVQKPYFDKLFAKNGMKILFYSPWPGQGFYTKFPVTKTADFKGKKLRIYSTATKSMGEQLGFNATILPFAEIPQAFSTGLIEALFTSPQTGIDIQAWDNTTHFTYAGAILSKNAVVVNARAFKKLPADVQKVVLAAAATAEKRAWEMSRETTEKQKAILTKNGMKVADAPPELIADMKKIGNSMMEEWKKTASPEAQAVLTNYLK
ncbi:MAG: TRAP transporter substrate-binding protein, partial [Alphaproteobacteria bacterium]|nr:TRAP transporter substrate-binding protein [Alphaproteobacteria bacterium]